MGGIDELNAVLGLARFYTHANWIKEEILLIQKNLVLVSSELAAERSSSNSSIDQKFVDHWELKSEELNSRTTTPATFIVPGNSQASSYINWARTIARRTERVCVGLAEAGQLRNTNILIWFNRLSVYLFLLTLQEDPNQALAKD